MERAWCLVPILLAAVLLHYFLIQDDIFMEGGNHKNNIIPMCIDKISCSVSDGVKKKLHPH